MNRMKRCCRHHCIIVPPSSTIKMLVLTNAASKVLSKGEANIAIIRKDTRGSTQTNFWWFEVTPSKHQNEFPSMPPVNSAYSIQSDAVENESYQSFPKYPSRQQAQL
ncbi:uncharacterized protein [Arachis hypogaea]|uniref:uncharacterized protein isoform X2 n=1 Tax=Arachis hypogaea TaxID=3818 RepID=UPI003B21AAD8